MWVHHFSRDSLASCWDMHLNVADVSRNLFVYGETDVWCEVLSFVHADASIILHPGALLVVRNAAFYTPFRGWRHLDGVSYSERPPYITGVKSSGGATIVVDNLVCKGLWRCVDTTSGASDHVRLADSLFVDNYEAMKVYWRDYSTQYGSNGLWITGSVFFSNFLGVETECLYDGCRVDQCLFLQNDVGIDDSWVAQVTRTILAQNEQAFQGSYGSYSDMLFYENDVAFSSRSAYSALGPLGNATFLENRIGMKLHSVVRALNRINFLGLGKEYHIHYTGASLFDLDVSLTFWNTTSVDEIEEDIYDARDGSGKGLVRIVASESISQTPFQHGMYQADSCAGQCRQSWFNTNWSSLISAGTGSFGFFDPDRSLHSGQVLRDALLTGYEPLSGMSLSFYMQDLTDLLNAVSKFQTVGTSTSPLPSTTASTTTTTTTTTTTLAEHLVVDANIIMTDPLWITENTTWTSSDGIRALAVRVEVLPGISLTLEGSRNSSLVLALDSFNFLEICIIAIVNVLPLSDL